MNKKGNSKRKEYISRINRVIDYIETNIGEEFSLGTLAEVACFSQFHFHRIFKAMSGETLNQFIQRLRLEKAAAQLIHWPEKSITDIAFDCGFSGSAAFARAFKAKFQMSASQWRSENSLQNSKICKTNSKFWKDFDISSYYIDSVTNNLMWRIQMKDRKHFKIEVKNMPEFHVAYVRHIGPYKGDNELFESLFIKLMNWAGPRGLLNFPETLVMAVYHDDPKITEENKLRTSACVTVPEKTYVEGEIGKMKIPGGEYAVAGFELSGSEEYEKAWNLVFADWLPESGYQPDDRPCYEIYRNNPKEHPEQIHIVDICVPVKPL